MLVVGFILSVVGALLVGAVVWGRVKRAELERAEVLTAPILSTPKGVVVLLVPGVAGIVATVLLASKLLHIGPEHAAGVVIAGSSVGIVLPALAYWLAYPWIQRGRLELTPSVLTLQVDDQEVSIDLGRRFTVTEGWSEVGGTMLNVLYVEQLPAHIVFSYPFARSGHERLPGMRPVGPNAGIAGRIMRERLVANPNATPQQPELPP